MKKLLSLPTLALSLALVGCGSGASVSENLLENPLFVEHYAEEVIRTYVNLEINQDASLEDESNASYAKSVKKEWLNKVQKLRKQMREGYDGVFIPMKELSEGEVLYLGDTLYFSPDFYTEPSIDLHVYLTQTVDPRDVEFPDITAIDLGSLKTPFGAQSYAVEGVEDAILYRTVVLWDDRLKRLHSFAQISSSN